MKRFCFALDLKDDPRLIAEYEQYHREVWPEIISSIRSAGIQKLDIYRVANRLFMIMETSEQFSLEEKAIADTQNEKVQEWELLMWKYQQAIPGSKPGEKWRRMDLLFSMPE